MAGHIVSSGLPLRKVRYDARYISSNVKCPPGMF